MDRVQYALKQALRENTDEGLLDLYENASLTLSNGKGPSFAALALLSFYCFCHWHVYDETS
jgi:hypothetical protein